MKAVLSEDKTELTISVDEETRQMLLDAMENDDLFDTDGYTFDLFDSFIANSEYEWISPVLCMDLTDAPLLATFGEERELPEGAGGDGSGWIVSGPGLGMPVEGRWGWMNYAVSSIQQELAENGSVTLTGGPVIAYGLT